MSEATDLRDLARKIENITRQHRANSMARETVNVCVDTLTLRARNMELEARLDDVHNQLPMSDDVHTTG